MVAHRAATWLVQRERDGALRRLDTSAARRGDRAARHTAPLHRAALAHRPRRPRERVDGRRFRAVRAVRGRGPWPNRRLLGERERDHGRRARRLAQQRVPAGAVGRPGGHDARDSHAGRNAPCRVQGAARRGHRRRGGRAGPAMPCECCSKRGAVVAGQHVVPDRGFRRRVLRGVLQPMGARAAAARTGRARRPARRARFWPRLFGAQSLLLAGRFTRRRVHALRPHALRHLGHGLAARPRLPLPGRNAVPSMVAGPANPDHRARLRRRPGAGRAARRLYAQVAHGSARGRHRGRRARHRLHPLGAHRQL
mmetsp:Transcript_1265/g.4153  ORF Transcript_1265/g.4153 Transcript_1265/m.4153 type:complete len:310 (+) Transcript_1265:294-1223(+)